MVLSIQLLEAQTLVLTCFGIDSDDDGISSDAN